MSAVDQFTVGTNGLPPVDASVEFLLPFAVTLSTGNVTGVSFSVCQVIDANTCNTVSGLGSFTATSFATPPTAGTYRVTATKSGYSSPTADFTIASGGATATIPLSFTLTARTITVTVKRHNGNAVTNASFTRCDPDDCANTTATVTATQTGANTGVYTFVAPATAGDYQLTATGASPAGSGTASFSVVANGAPSTSTLAIDFPAPGP